MRDKVQLGTKWFTVDNYSDGPIFFKRNPVVITEVVGETVIFDTEDTLRHDKGGKIQGRWVSTIDNFLEAFRPVTKAVPVGSRWSRLGSVVDYESHKRITVLAATEEGVLYKYDTGLISGIDLQIFHDMFEPC